MKYDGVFIDYPFGLWYIKFMSIGEKIYLLREKQGLSQEELAEKLNVSRQTISNWENDKVKIDVEKAGELCRIFNVSMDELFGMGDACFKNAVNKKPSAPVIAVCAAALIICIALIVVSAVFLSKHSPGETSSTIILTPAAGWVIISLCALIIAGITISLIILRKKK